MRPERPMSEAWHLQAHALAEALKAEGRIDPGAFSSALSTALTQMPDDDAGYWTAYLATLERLTAPVPGLDPATVATRKAAWEDAYRRTPHGRPVTLEA
ncbi:nitrile hydratase accessory protein [Rhodobacteraceae bacterium CCMM004]|nr:nitrile hydratase accessory protein [Rhodobacteraceae bacterium CCMM004]